MPVTVRGSGFRVQGSGVGDQGLGFKDSGVGDLIRTSISEKYDFSMKITTRVKLSVTSQVNRVVIFVANRIGDPRNPRNRISQKYSPRLDQGLGFKDPPWVF